MARLYKARHALMVQGTTSGAGKSTLVAGLCRVLARRGVRVAPFKPQNMSLNSAVSADGGEIARAQALQAQAARTAALTDMNPVLLKPSSDTRAQLIVEGKVRGELEAGDYQRLKRTLLEPVVQAFSRLSARFDSVIVEGAGSPAEINLREDDIANMGFAEAIDCPVVLVGDIDRGGLFAHFLGTLECLAQAERERINGFVINRFRGERALLDGGIQWLEKQTGKPVFGVLPQIEGLILDAEDALPQPRARPNTCALEIVVPVCPRISNHTDFEPLRAHPGVELRFAGPRQALGAADLVILPGSKNVRADLEFLRECGWDREISRHLRYGGKLIGICGGMQMLGRAIHDPLGVEGPAGSSRGLALLDFETTLGAEKQLENVSGTLFPGSARETSFRGYEIHMGKSAGPALEQPMLRIGDRVDGVSSSDGQILASYVHGLFDGEAACQALLAWAGAPAGAGADFVSLREKNLERLADIIERELDLERMFPTRALRAEEMP